MSKVGSTNMTGQIFKPVLTNATWEELSSIETPLAAHNAIIFSVPIDKDNEDIKGAGSIWLTDNDGYLYCISNPINKANT